MRNFAFVAVMAVTCSASLTAQQIIFHGPPGEGQWAGPYDLADAMDILNQNPIVREITHAIMIPPQAPGVESPHAGSVMFITDRANQPNPPSSDWLLEKQPTYVWSPSAPTTVARFDLPNAPDTDTFCGGHASLGTGQPIVVGGLNRVMGGGSGIPPYAHGTTFVLRTDEPTLRWDKHPLSAEERWYTTVCTLPNGDVGAFGHSGDPDPDINRYRDIFVQDPLDPLLNGWNPSIPNRDVGTDCFSSNVNDFISMHHYPRTHVLSTGQLIWADGRGHATGHQSRFLSVDLSLATDCDPLHPSSQSGTTYDDYHWRSGTQALAPDPGCGAETVETHRQVGGQTAHFVTYGGVGGPGENDPGDYDDTIYMMGGSIIGQDDKACPCEDYAEDLVKRISTPSSGDWLQAKWDWPREDQCDSPAPSNVDHYPTRMHYPRVNHNAVILLDGSIFVVGGVDDDPNSSDCPTTNPAGLGCLHRQTPELYRPPEIYPNLVQTKWTKMADQTAKRQYHSVAGLLPDGRVFSAGGTYRASASDSDHQSVEVYSPTYFFKGRRPSIRKVTGTLGPFAQTLSYGQEIDIVFTVSNDKAPKRFALLRPASVTHAFDSNQRYIVLNVASQLDSDGDRKWDVKIVLPPNGSVAPPGWYLLTGVDGDGRPSSAKWIYIQ